MIKKVERKIHKLDAAGQAAGRLATQIVTLLRGKNKADFMPNLDRGDSVEVVNVKDLKFTGKKLEQKEYYHHTGYVGHLKTRKMSKVFSQNPAEVLELAVYQMLPKNRLRKEMMKRLKIS